MDVTGTGYEDICNLDLQKYSTLLKHRKNCKSCQSQVTWKVKFKCQDDKQDRQNKHKKNRTDKLTFKLDFPGNLCRAAFAILAMFSQKVLLERMREKIMSQIGNSKNSDRGSQIGVNQRRDIVFGRINDLI